MNLPNRHSFKLRPLSMAVAMVIACASQVAYTQTVTKTLQIDTPSLTDPGNVAPGDLLNYTVTITNNTGASITNIDLTDALTAPAGTSLVAGSTNISGVREVRIYRDNISVGDEFDDAGTSGDDGNIDFVSNWDELDGNGSGGETDGATGTDTADDVIITTNSGREVIRIRDDNGQGNGRGEGIGRTLNLLSCVENILTFDIAGSGLDDSTDSIFVDESISTLTGTAWTQLVDFDVNFTGSTGTQRDIINNTYQTNSVDLTLTGSANHHIRFMTDDGNANNDGAFIDNVQVTAICGVVADISGTALATLMDSGDLDGSSEYTDGEDIYGLLDTESITVTYQVLVDDGAATGAASNDFDIDSFDAYSGAGPVNGTGTISTTVSYFDDAGDAPDTSAGSGTGDYTTLLANGGPRHRIVAGMFLGDQLADIDSGGFVEGTDAGGDASDDDVGGDEGEVQLLTTDTTFPALTSTDTSYSLDLDYSSTAGTSVLYGWIDFDGNGEFEESERASATGLTGSGSTTLSWTSTPGISAGTTYARFRISSDTLDVVDDADTAEDDASIGFASDGEVEDYQFAILPPPICYAAYSDASINSTVFDLLGLSPTITGNQSNFNVQTNNNDGDNENYGMILTTELIVPSTGSYTFWLSSDDGSHLYIDDKLVIDNDGLHGVVTVTATINLTAGVHDLQTFFFENAGGDSMQLEWDGSGSRADVLASEVQPPTICPTNPSFPLDYGDADAAYADSYHTIGFEDDFSIGSVAPDAEISQPSSVAADGDDNAGTNDEDASPSLSGLDNLVTGNYVVSVAVANAGADATLGGWIDFDGDNVFEANEFASATVTSSDTSVDLTFDTNAATVIAGTTYARFRISRDTLTSASANGVLLGGEVEDYGLNIADASQVYFEAECGIIGDEWTAFSDTNASENVFVETVNDRTSTLTGVQPVEDMIQYQITVPIAGTYDIYARISVDGGESFHLSYDNSTWWAHDLPDTGGVFDWVDLEPNIQNGTYQELVTTVPNEVVTIYMAYREANASVDKFALLSDDSSVPTGLGNAVGSCFDFGDAPDTTLNTTGTGDYVTLLSNTLPGPIHLVDSAPAVYLGSTAPDTENDALQNSDATGDDSIDEGEAQLISTAASDVFPALYVTDTGYSLEIDVTNNKAVDATVVAWIDFDKDGLFEVGEQADANPIVSASAGSTQATLNWTGLTGLTDGTTFARFRVSTDTELTTNESIDVVIDGEVEDHQLAIVDLGEDYGDAPLTVGAVTNAYDDTDKDGDVDGADNPAVHTIISGLSLGSDPDADTGVWSNGTDANNNASDDDAEGSDDEDGANPSSIDQNATSYSVSLTVNNSDAANTASVFAWIDFDRDGLFEESERATLSAGTVSPTGLTIPASSSGTISLDWSGLSGLTGGSTYLRVRITTDASLLEGSDGAVDEASFGSAIGGEVEDYQITISSDDYGDAPTIYGDAIHAILGSPTLYLGPSIPDADGLSQQGGDVGVGADGDDGDGSDDESSVTTIPNLSSDQIGETYSLSVNVVNTTDDASADLFGWIDFDGNDIFDTDESVTINTPSNGVYQLDWIVPGDVVVGETYVRLRLTTDASVTTATPIGSATDGEVEDYALAVTDPLDFGDAIDSSIGTAALDYRTELADDGPRHLLSANLFLGDVEADADGDAIDNGGATGDDINDASDEGISQLLTTAQGTAFPALTVADASFDFDIDLTNSGAAANLYVWVDYDHSGSFDEDELAGGSAISVLNGAISASVSSVPTGDAIVGNTYMRLRLTRDGAIVAGSDGGEDEASYGLASDGEVEDYRITITGLDFGDAPDTYATDKTDGGEGVGPSHVQTGTLYIGDSLPDLDSDGLPGTGASGDDADGDDEGGFSIPVIGVSDTSYSITLPLVNNTGTTATLFGWLDIDENGVFDTSESVSVTVPSGAISATLDSGNWTGFSTLSGSQTYLRLRLTTDASITTATPGGAASDGEVEDHLVIVGLVDFGDAPDTYSTDSTAGNDGAGGFDGIGPSHGINGALYLGDTVPDGDPDGGPSALANDDDNTGSADESPLTITPAFPLLTPASEIYSLPVVVVNTTGANAELVGWIDFDGNGFFDNDEGATVTVPNLATSVDLVWGSIPGDITLGDTFIRLRLTSDISIATGDAATSSPKGPATDGEVEDHIISIATAYDYGDAPDSYGTDGTDGGEGFGPRHIISPLLYLGSFAPDAELDGQASADALLDDDTGTGEATTTDSTDGDEGDLFITTIQPDQLLYSLSVPLKNATGSIATLYGWLDLNQDGDFEDTNESQTTTILPGSSFGTLTFSWASGNTSSGDGLDNGSTFLRLRLSSESGLEPTETLVTDFANDGEVEDYRVQVSQLTCDLLYGIYNDGGYTSLREFDNDTVSLATTSFQSAGIGIERNYRRFYYMEWPTGADRDLRYFDPTATPSTDVATGATIATSGNYNRMAFAYGGRGVIVESSSYDVYMFDPTVSGIGQSITNAIDMTNAGAILGGGGDIAFDRDDNLYMLTYDTGDNEFYLYEIRFTLTAGGASVEIPDLVLTGSPETTYEATAFLLLTEANPTGAQIGGMAFNFDNLIYLQGSGANTTFTWDVGITATGGTGAIQGPTDDEASSDLASCIYPYIRAIIEPVKTVVNSTSGGAGYVPGDTLEYSILVRNSGGFPSFDTIFQDDIQPGTTYVPNSTTMNGDPLTDTGGLMPFVVGREIHTDTAADGIVLADITPGIVGDNEVVITYQVLVDADGSNTEICNQGFVDYEANLSSAVPTNDPGTGTADDSTCLSQTSGFKVSGTLFEDLNVNGIQSGSEPGIDGVAMVLYDSVAGSCESTLTDANGFYEFASVTSGPKTVYEVSGAAVPVPLSCPPALGNDPSGYLSSTTNSSSIYVVNANVTDLDFGDVQLPSLNPNLEGVVIPGGTQTYSHLFRAPTDGDVSFTVASIDNPVLSGWSSLIYEDLDCSGDLSAGDYPIISSVSLVAGESICLINRVFAPSSAVAGNTLLSDLTATFNYDGALVSNQDVEANDVTTVLDSGDSALQLTKRVRNITDTSSEFDVAAGISNAAKPGDRLRYEISFSNTGVGNITDIDIYDSVPAFTELAEVLDTSCDYTGPVAAPLSAIVPPTIMTACTLVAPAGGANAIGYSGSLHWQLTGTLQPGQSGLIVFTVDVQ